MNLKCFLFRAADLTANRHRCKHCHMHFA